MKKQHHIAKRPAIDMTQVKPARQSLPRRTRNPMDENKWLAPLVGLIAVGLIVLAFYQGKQNLAPRSGRPARIRAKSCAEC